MQVWMKVVIHKAQYEPGEWVHATWAVFCESLRGMASEFDYVFTALETHLQEMQARPPRQTDARPKITKRQKIAKRQKVGTTNPAHQCEPAAVATEAQPLAAGEHAAPGAAAPAACDQTGPNPESAAAGHDHSQQRPSSRDLGGKKSKIATTAPLMQARRRRNRKPGMQFTDRRNKFRELLVEMTSSLKPVKTREVYASFRKRFGQDTKSLTSVPLRKIVLSVCNNVAGIEYFLQSESPPNETCKTTTPFASEMMPSGTLDQEKFVLAGNVTILGKTVFNGLLLYK